MGPWFIVIQHMSQDPSLAESKVYSVKSGQLGSHVWQQVSCLGVNMSNSQVDLSGPAISSAQKRKKIVHVGLW